MEKVPVRAGLHDKMCAIPIYKYIKDYISCIPVITFQKGEYLFRGEDRGRMMFYLLKGIVEVENVTYSGKKLIIENVRENMFTGSIANMHQVNLQSSGVAITTVQTLVFSETIIDRLMEDDKFSIFFYQETSVRIFRMYKIVMAKILFSPNEIMAQYILDHTPGGVFTFKSFYSLSENIGISRRGIYNILARFEGMRCIRKKRSAMYEITDRRCLEQQARYITDFMRN